eukprot:GHVU01045199.1.p1 GENE.GHVU01045199.1~~GHVU01045199.1.p1  ORF type:complete len:119 (+),score=12.13 GHVU01045199.1:200-556(+)
MPACLAVSGSSAGDDPFELLSSADEYEIMGSVVGSWRADTPTHRLAHVLNGSLTHSPQDDWNCGTGMRTLGASPSAMCGVNADRQESATSERGSEAVNTQQLDEHDWCLTIDWCHDRG